jgi:hypothetical protein
LQGNNDKSRSGTKATGVCDILVFLRENGFHHANMLDKALEAASEQMMRLFNGGKSAAGFVRLLAEKTLEFVKFARDLQKDIADCLPCWRCTSSEAELGGYCA